MIFRIAKILPTQKVLALIWLLFFTLPLSSIDIPEDIPILQSMEFTLVFDPKTTNMNVRFEIENPFAEDLCYNYTQFPYQAWRKVMDYDPKKHKSVSVPIVDDLTIVTESGDHFIWYPIADMPRLKEFIKRFPKGEKIEAILPVADHDQTPSGKLYISYYLHMVACNNSDKPEFTLPNDSIYSAVAAGRDYFQRLIDYGGIVYHGKVTLNPEDWLHSDQVRRSNPELVKSQ